MRLELLFSELEVGPWGADLLQEFFLGPCQGACRALEHRDQPPSQSLHGGGPPWILGSNFWPDQAAVARAGI